MRLIALIGASRWQVIFACLALSVAFAAVAPASAQETKGPSNCEMAAAQPLFIPPLAAHGTPGGDKQADRAVKRAETFFACLNEEAAVCSSAVCDPAPIPGFPASIEFFIEDGGLEDPVEGCSSGDDYGCWWFAAGCFVRGDKPVTIDPTTVLCCPANPDPGAPPCPGEL